MNGEELRYDLEMNEQKLFELTGIRPTLFRPPEGVCNDNVKKTAKEMGYSIIMWTVDTNDWQGIDSEKIVDCVKKNTVSGSIILFHDFVSGRSGTPDALEVIIPYLLSEGYTFVTVSQLLGLKA
jgi:peptidoglycan/xylan/chitin deacetylase (PgdA/CDA1 family)